MEDHTAGSGHDVNCGDHSVFHGGYNEILFFPDLRISSEQQLLGACVVVFLIALLNEGLRLLVSWLQGLVNTQEQPAQPVHQALRNDQSVWALGVLHTLSYILHLFVHYCLMLVFMSLNVWLCLSLLLGAGTGFVLFHFHPVKSRVFRFFGAREQPQKAREEKDNYSEMTDMSNDQLDDFKWNGSLKEK